MMTDFLIVILFGLAGGGALALFIRRVVFRHRPDFEKVKVRQRGSVDFVIVERLVRR